MRPADERRWLIRLALEKGLGMVPGLTPRQGHAHYLFCVGGQGCDALADEILAMSDAQYAEWYADWNAARQRESEGSP